MPPIINAQEISKRFGADPLLENISFTVNAGDRIGLIGPNGSGKSTLLQILSGRLDPDHGHVAIRRRTRVAFVGQHSEFAPGITIRRFIEEAMERASIPEADRVSIFAETLGRAGLMDVEMEASALSGGWRKRLAIVEGLVQQADVLLLDEPTNHLDLAGIKWLEAILETSAFASVVVSHDRYLLEAFASEVVELSRAYAEGLLRVEGTYGRFLEAKEAYLQAQGQRQESLANRVRNEMEWLRRGAKARSSKAKARIDKANELIGELADVRARSRTDSVQIDFSATNRRTKQLVEMRALTYAIEGRTLFQNLEFSLKAGMRVGLVGPNGSGKTTLLRLLRGELMPASGAIRTAEHLRIVYFDQKRQLDPDVTLRRALAPDGDSVLYQDRLIHVASWAARFLFDSEDLNQPVGKLSGGERARVLIAQLMLQSADVLLLDEPTNDLDIPTLDILEESLLEYPGALVLVTHDRFMMDRIATIVLGLDGLGRWGQFADYSQWEEWQRMRLIEETTPRATAVDSRPATPRRKLSYHEAREYEAIESRIAAAEEDLRARKAELEDPAIASNASRLVELTEQIQAAEQTVDALYARWSELESKI